MNHYDVLGISHSADRATVLAAYRRRIGDARARVQHARLAESRREAERRLHEIEEARHVLGDPHRRLAYDLSLIPVSAPAGPGQPALDRPIEPPQPTVRSVQWLDEPRRRLDEPRRRLDEPRRRLDEPPEAAETVGPPSTPFLEGLATPPPEPTGRWDWRWVGAIALLGLAAFITGLALITGGLRPVMVGPQPPVPVATPGAGVLPAGPISPAGPSGGR